MTCDFCGEDNATVTVLDDDAGARIDCCGTCAAGVYADEPPLFDDDEVTP